MSDTISVLRHAMPVMAKTWNADGTIGDYGDAKYYRLEQHQVDSMPALSALLTKLETEPQCCVIRGAYVGDELASTRDGQDYVKGKVRRALDYFDDQPLHALLVDVDTFVPLTVDPNDDPAGAIDEFVFSMLPDEFKGASFHWQLSNSFGHPTKLGQLRAHLWFWLETPYTSAQLTAWAKVTKYQGDLSVLRTVQVHYTSNPIMEPGVTDAIVVRSGFVDGLTCDAVPLVIAPDIAAQAAVQSGGRRQRLADVASDDPIASALYEQGLVRSAGRDGGLNVVCPFVDEHGSGEGAESSTMYYPPNTGGYATGNFKCLHAACVGRGRGQFLARLGVDEVLDDFEDVSTPPMEEGDTAPRRKGIPEANHLTTDQANAGRIVSKFGKRLIVVAGQWYAWTGMRWEKDDGEVYRFACMLSKIIHAEADAWRAKKTTAAEESERNGKVADVLTKWAAKSEMKAAIEAAVGLAKKMLTVGEDQIDRNPWLLNCLNGVVDLRTGVLQPHNPDDFITKLVALEYDPTARSTAWENVIAKVTLEEGMTTRPMARFLQRWFGYCATGSTREQAFIVHFGQGSNGKSTILDTVAEVLGDYATTGAPGLLVGNGRGRHPTEIADLFGRRMVTAHETGEGGHLKEDTVKQLTGSDKVKARFMNRDFFEFDPTHKLQLLTNYKPIIKGQDNGIWRRVLLMPYMARFASSEEVMSGRAHFVKDTRIAERLKGEIQGVLTWVVEGARVWFQDGLQAPDAVLAASKDYQTEQDRVGQFVTECCELGKEFEVPLSGEFGGIYDAYRTWCGEGGFVPLSKTRLVQELERLVPYFAKAPHKQPGSAGKRKNVVMLTGLKTLGD